MTLSHPLSNFQQSPSHQFEKPRTLILDCNRFELVTLADSLRMNGLDVIGQARDVQSATQLFHTVHPDSVLINFQGCDSSTLELLATFRAFNPQLGIVLLTDSPDLRLYGIQQRDLPRGTQIIEKSALNEIREIREALDLSRNPDALTSWLAIDWSPSLSSLTDIQIETLRLLASGLSNADIGKARFVSEKSVEQTITRIAQHLQVIHEKGRNMRVILASEYFKWLGSPRERAI